MDKQYYMVEMEVMIPATMKYKVLATSAREALDIANSSGGANLYSGPHIRKSVMKKIEAKVYSWAKSKLEWAIKF